MRVETYVLTEAAPTPPPTGLSDATVVLGFFSQEFPQKEGLYDTLHRLYPQATILLGSTGGEICNAEVTDGSAVVTAIKLEKTPIRTSLAPLAAPDQSLDAGKMLACDLFAPDLKFVFILSEGLLGNGSALLKGLLENLPPDVLVAGGCAGDGDHFGTTTVGLDARPQVGQVAAIGFYGNSFYASCSSVGGWVKFGPQRLITRSKGNVLYELDDQDALALYKKYVGPESSNLLSDSLFYPLSISPTGDSSHEVVRTFLSINPDGSLNFAGDVPQGDRAQLMRANFDNLIDGAENAAMLALSSMKIDCKPDNSLALLISCVGRRGVMGQHIADEVVGVSHILPPMPIAGFYSYGEIGPHAITQRCDLHNETMTVVLMAEK